MWLSEREFSNGSKVGSLFTIYSAIHLFSKENQVWASSISSCLHDGYLLKTSQYCRFDHSITSDQWFSCRQTVGRQWIVLKMRLFEVLEVLWAPVEMTNEFILLTSVSIHELMLVAFLRFPVVQSFPIFVPRLDIFQSPYRVFIFASSYRRIQGSCRRTRVLVHENW